MRVSSRVNIYFCVCLLCFFSEREEKDKKSEAFDLGYTTLILNASQKKKTNLKREKGARLSLFCCASLIILHHPLREHHALRLSSCNERRKERAREREREREEDMLNKEDFSFVRFFPFT